MNCPSSWQSQPVDKEAAMNYIADEPFRGSVGDLLAFQRPGLENIKRFIREEILAGAERYKAYSCTT